MTTSIRRVRPLLLAALALVALPFVLRALGLSLERAAHGAHQIAASNMIRAIKAVSTERGRDPIHLRQREGNPAANRHASAHVTKSAATGCDRNFFP